MAQWIKLSAGWLDLGRVAFVADTPAGGLALYDDFGTNTSPVRYLGDADADALRTYLDQNAVNKPAPAMGVYRPPARG